ncbi:MAG: GntR family transcriptional regulator, partial [Mesorhizobium sp.]
MSDIFSRIEHSRTADEVVQQIESLILEGVLRTGDRLPGERELARQFDVGEEFFRRNDSAVGQFVVAGGNEALQLFLAHM